MTADLYAERLALDYAQIEHIARVRPDSALFSRSNVNISQASSSGFFWVDPAIADVFSFEFVQGSRDTSLLGANVIVLNETTARKYFGNENPIGQTLTFNNRAELQVTGIMRDLPANTYLQIEAMIPVAAGQQIYGPDFMRLSNWITFADTQTYFSVQSDAEAQAIANDLDGFIDRNIPDVSRARAEQVGLTLSLEPLNDVYLSPRDGYNSGGPVRARIFYGLVLFALLILVTSCVNFANLSMSQVQQRAKEIGIRKIIGAGRMQIAIQFLFESFMLTFIALMVSLPVVYLVVPAYTSLTDTAFTFSSMLEINSLLLILLAVLATGLFSGLLPALALSRLQPVYMVKGIKSNGKLNRIAKSVFTVFQFALSNTLIILAICIVLLISHLNEMTIGFDRFNLVVLDNNFGRREMISEYQSMAQRNSALINELQQHPGIIAVSESQAAPPGTGYYNPWRKPQWPDGETRLMSHLSVDENYLDAMQLELIAGRGFSQDFPADFVTGPSPDTDQTYGAIITRSALRNFEFESPEEALGEILLFLNYTYRIVGVVEDIRFSGGLENLQTSTNLLRATNQPMYYTLVRIDPRQMDSALDYLDETWAKHRPDTPIDRRFFEQTYDEMIYERTNGVNQASLLASIITVSIAAMGLFALASNSCQRRVKEIGVRKAIGATSGSIVGLLTWDFVKPVAVACLISWITGYYAVSFFFAQFSSFPEVSFWVYIVVALGTLILAVCTVSAQCIKAASANPMESLRCE